MRSLLRRVSEEVLKGRHGRRSPTAWHHAARLSCTSLRAAARLRRKRRGAGAASPAGCRRLAGASGPACRKRPAGAHRRRASGADERPRPRRQAGRAWPHAPDARERSGAGRGAAPGASSSGWPSWCSRVALAALGAIALSATGRASTPTTRVAEEAFDGAGGRRGHGARGPDGGLGRACVAINPDAVGWVYVPGTAVNYPIVHSGDDENVPDRRLLRPARAAGGRPTYGAVFLSGGERGPTSRTRTTSCTGTT